MNFVFDLPLNPSGKNGLVVIFDIISRQAHFIALNRLDFFDGFF
jgi:hypothetical protein